MNSIIKKCFKPSKEKYQFVIFVLLFMLGTIIYIGYNLYYYESYMVILQKKKDITSNTKFKKSEGNGYKI
jgi:hypothetical protein